MTEAKVWTEADREKAQRRAFWRGVVEGFGGPALLSLDLNLPSPNCLTLREVRPSRFTSREIGEALARAAELVREKHGLTSFVVKQKRLDGSGKMRDIDVLLVEPGRSSHGKP